METFDPVTSAWGIEVVSYSERKVQPLYMLTTESGIQLSCSSTAPIPVRGGEYVLAPNMLGNETLVMYNGVVTWEAVTQVVYLGEREIQHITCGDKCFFAGDKYGSFVLHHNKMKSPVDDNSAQREDL